MGKPNLISVIHLFIFISAFIFSANAKCVTLVAATGNSDINERYIHDADASTGLLSSGRISTWFNALDASPDNVLYAATISLYTIDPYSGSFSHIGGLPEYLPSIAFSPDGKLYGVNIGGSKLYEIDPATSDSIDVIQTSNGRIDAIDFSPDGILYGLDWQFKKIYTVDTSTGVCSYHATINGVIPGPVSSMDYGSDGIIRVYGEIEPDRTYNGLYEINPLSGLSTLIGPAQNSSLPLSVSGLASIDPIPDPVSIQVEPDDFTVGTNIENAWLGAVLSVEGRADAEVFSVDGYDDNLGTYIATTGTLIFGNTPVINSVIPTGQVWDEATFGLLRADFDVATDSVSIDLIYGADGTGRLSAYDSDGNLLDSITEQGDGRGASSPFCPPFCDPVTPVSIQRTTPDIAYILVGGVGAEPVYLDNMTFNYWPDADGDGILNGDDNCPSNYNVNQTDSDGDGVGNLCDAFPYNPSETLDSDGDGVGDNTDAFPQDPNEILDSDGDGVGNNADAFPYDPNETLDSDGDGVGNNADAFPLDPNETLDSDGDGVGDNADVFPFDPNRVFNIAPIADAGLDVAVNLNGSVQLDGSGSSDVDGDVLSYVWSFTSKPVGSSATLSNVAAVYPVFTADLTGSYEVQLIVNDGLLNSAPDSVVIEAVNLAPLLISEIPDQFAKECSELGPLDASTYFSDPEGDKLVFSIISGLPSGTGVEINADTGVISGAPTLFDAVNQPLNIRVSATDGTSILNNTTDTFILNIEQANRGTVQLTSKTFSVQENENFAIINLERVNGSDCLTSVVVEASESRDILTSAISDYDFETLDGFSTWFSLVSWKAGEAGIKPFYVPIVNDTNIESDETIAIKIVVRDLAVIDYCPFGTCEGILTIKDDDVIVVDAPVETASDEGGSGGTISPLLLMNIVFLVYLMRLHASCMRPTRRQHEVKNVTLID